MTQGKHSSLPLVPRVIFFFKFKHLFLVSEETLPLKISLTSVLRYFVHKFGLKREIGKKNKRVIAAKWRKIDMWLLLGTNRETIYEESNYLTFYLN